MKGGQNNKYNVPITPGFRGGLFGKGQLISEYFSFVFFQILQKPNEFSTDLYPSIIISIGGFSLFDSTTF